MSDLYTQVVNSPPGRMIASRVGLPQPAELERRANGGAAELAGAVLFGAAPGGRLGKPIERLLGNLGAPRPEKSDSPVKGLVFDATGIANSTELVELQRFFHPNVKRVEQSGRVIVLGTPSAGLPPRAATAQRALEGFTRSLGKEVGRGIAVQLVYVAEGAESEIDSTLRFLLSPRSAYVSGQVIEVGGPVAKAPAIDWSLPLDGKIALVTGASRGIGEAIAETLHRDGAALALLDVPALAPDLARVAKRLDAETIELDITEEDAPAAIADALSGGVDIVVHNAGVTRDRTIAKMPEDRWSSLMEINLSSEERIDDELLARKLLRENGRIVCVSSMSGVAGNSGQTNYATSKAGVIGMVEAMAPELAKQKATINAVAPGFIETQMTAQMPIAIREAGRRMNSMSQGGLPVDVAETIAWFASPASAGVNGNVVRVCGQSLLGGLMSARTLESPPSILPLYARAAAPLVPGASLLPFVPGRSKEIPEIELVLPGVRADAEQVAAYARVCGFGLRDHLPPTYPHVLAFPLHMAVMADGSFPFGAVGLVHVENRIVQQRPIGLHEELTIEVKPTQLQPHPKGRTFSLQTKVRSGNRIVWESTSTMLRRGGSDSKASTNPAKSELHQLVPPVGGEVDAVREEEAANAEWKLGGDLGRRYAAVSGDRNPIHMYGLSAKVLGFPRAIAHGMWTKARCLAALESRLPDAFAVDVRFRKPILLPGRVEFTSTSEGDEIAFAVRDAKRRTPHLDGAIKPLEAKPKDGRK